MLQQRRAICPCVHGLNSTGSLGSGIWARQMQVPTPLLIDVEMGDRLVTIPIGRNEMCSVISEKLELDLDQCYLMLDSKPLQWGRSLGDYDISKRCTIQVVPILCGGGTIFSVLFCFAFDVFYVVLFFSLFDTSNTISTTTATTSTTTSTTTSIFYFHLLLLLPLSLMPLLNIPHSPLLALHIHQSPLITFNCPY